MSTRWALNCSKWHPTQAQLMLGTACLQPEEKQRIARFVFKRDFKSSLVGRLMMRQFVARNSALTYKEIVFDRDAAHGKPILRNEIIPPMQLAFNVSHQGDFVVLAGETGIDRIGVDIMKLEYTGGKSLSEFFRIMTRNFAPSEWKTIRDGSLSASEQVTMFCRHWCLKESYVKAMGVGITVDLQEICFRIHTAQLSRTLLVRDTELFVRNQKQPWYFDEMLLDDEHCVAVASEVKLKDERFWLVELDELLVGADPLLEQDAEYCADYFKKLDK